MLEESVWAQIPPDVLVLLIQLIQPHDTAALMRTCTQWNYSIKSQLMALQPLYVSQPWRHNFSAARTVSIPIVRVKHEGFAYCIAPNRDQCGTEGKTVPISEVFPHLTSLDATGQTLLRISLLSLPSSVESLSLSCCDLSLHELQEALHQLPRLTHLDLAGLRAPDIEAGLAPFMDALLNCCNLTSLDLSHVNLQSWRGATPVRSMLGWRVVEVGKSLVAACPQLQHFSGLRKLRFLGQQPCLEGVAAVGMCSKLQDLSITCSASELDLEALEAWDGMLQNLTCLTSLHIELPARGLQPSSLHRNSLLKNLKLVNCYRMSLALSCSRLTQLTSLDLSHSLMPVSPELVVQACSRLPALLHLNVSHSRWERHFQLPGDVLVRGLAKGSRQLQTLKMVGIQMHGTGFSSPPGLPPVCALPDLRELVVSAGQLLKCKLQEIALQTQLRKLVLGSVTTQLLKCELQEIALQTQLRKLVLGSVTTQDFNATAKVNGYLEFSSLVHLTQLAILGLPHADPLPAQDQDPVGAAPPQAPVHNAQAQGNVHGQVPEANDEGQVDWQAALMAIDVSDDEFDSDDGSEDGDDHHAEGGGHGGAGHGAVGHVAVGLPVQGAVGLPVHVAAGLPVHHAEASEDSDDFHEDDDDDESDVSDSEDGFEHGSVAQGRPLSQLTAQREPHLYFVLALSGLQVLSLQTIESTGICFQHIKELKKLQVLHLSGSFSFSHAGLECLRRARMPSLRNLRLATCAWNQKPSSLPSSSNSVAHDQVTCNDLMQAIAGSMPSLEHLELGDCVGLSQAALSVFKSMRSMRYLILHRNPIAKKACRDYLTSATNIQYFASSSRSASHCVNSLPLGIALASNNQQGDSSASTSKAALEHLLSDGVVSQHFSRALGGYVLTRYHGRLVPVESHGGLELEA
eukprot:gene1704-33109_t